MPCLRLKEVISKILFCVLYSLKELKCKMYLITYYIGKGEKTTFTYYSHFFYLTHIKVLNLFMVKNYFYKSKGFFAFSDFSHVFLIFFY